MSVTDIQPDCAPLQEHEPMIPAGHSPSALPLAPVEQSVTRQRPVSALGWGLALAGGMLGWALLIAWLR